MNLNSVVLVEIFLRKYKSKLSILKGWYLIKDIGDWFNHPDCIRYINVILYIVVNMFMTDFNYLVGTQ